MNESSKNTDVNYDRVAYVAVGKELGFIDIEVTQDFTYSGYEEHWESCQSFIQLLEEYDSLFEECGGIATGEKCGQLFTWYNELEEQYEESGWCWEQVGIVRTIEIYW